MANVPTSASVRATRLAALRPLLRGSLIRTGLVFVLWVAVKTFLTPAELQAIIEMKSQAGPSGELFFASGTEAYSPDRRVPFTVNSDGKWHAYRVAIPASRVLSRLRIDPGTDEGGVSIRRLEVRAQESVSLTAERLTKAIGGTNRMQRLPANRDAAVNLSSEGGDPFVEFLLPADIGGVSQRMSLWRAALDSVSSVMLWLAMDILAAASLGWLWRQERRNVLARTVSGTLYDRIAWSFLGSSAILGLCLAFGQPVFSAPDEPMHWQVGHMRAERLLGDEDCIETLPFGRGDMPAKTLPPYKSLRGMPLNCLGRYEIYGDLMTYPGVLLSKLILPRQQESAIRQFQAVLVARLLQGTFFLIVLTRLVLLSRRTARPGVLAVTALALSPLFAQQAFSVSSDGAQLCFGACLFAAMMFWEHLTWFDVVLFFVFGWGSGGKPFVLPCILPSVIAGFWYAEVRANRATFGHSMKALIAALKPSRRMTAQTGLLWTAVLLSLQVVAYYLIEAKRGSFHTTTFPNVDQSAQLAGVLVEPRRLIGVILRYGTSALSNVASYTGPLGWLDTPLSAAAVNGFVRLVAVGAGAELLALALWVWKPVFGPKHDFIQRTVRVLAPLLLALGGAAAGGVLIITVLYLIHTPVGADYVLGVQVRYFFPLMMAAIGGVFGAVATALNLPDGVSLRVAEPADVPSGSEYRFWSKTRGLVVNVLPPLIVFALSLPYVARVFVDLGQRYL